MQTPLEHSPQLLQSYRHYKGGTYTLLMVARNSEERDQQLAVYVSHLTRQVWVRPWIMFNERVLWDDGIYRARFIPMDEIQDSKPSPSKPITYPPGVLIRTRHRLVDAGGWFVLARHIEQRRTNTEGSIVSLVPGQSSLYFVEHDASKPLAVYSSLDFDVM